MSRRSTGGVVVDTRRKSPVFALRFRAYGRRQYVTLGSADEGWTRAKADDALRHTLADVERGIWQPPNRDNTPAPAPTLPQDPTFHEFASQWYAANEAGWRAKTRVDYQWQLTHHLLPFFAEHRLSQITIAEVDRYRTTRCVEGTLSARRSTRRSRGSAQILEVAVEYELIDAQPGEGQAPAREGAASRRRCGWTGRADRGAARRRRRAGPRRAARRPTHPAPGDAGGAGVRRAADR